MLVIILLLIKINIQPFNTALILIFSANIVQMNKTKKASMS